MLEVQHFLSTLDFRANVENILLEDSTQFPWIKIKQPNFFGKYIIFVCGFNWEQFLVGLSNSLPLSSLFISHLQTLMSDLALWSPHKNVSLPSGKIDSAIFQNHLFSFSERHCSKAQMSHSHSSELKVYFRVLEETLLRRVVYKGFSKLLTYECENVVRKTEQKRTLSSRPIPKWQICKPSGEIQRQIGEEQIQFPYNPSPQKTHKRPTSGLCHHPETALTSELVPTSVPTTDCHLKNVSQKKSDTCFDTDPPPQAKCQSTVHVNTRQHRSFIINQNLLICAIMIIFNDSFCVFNSEMLPVFIPRF